MLQNNANTQRPHFELGQIVATPGSIQKLALAQVKPDMLLHRHRCGDWGEIDEEDVRANEAALSQGGRLFSAYTLPTSERVWIITEWDRSYTTICCRANTEALGPSPQTAICWLWVRDQKGSRCSPA